MQVKVVVVLRVRRIIPSLKWFVIFVPRKTASLHFDFYFFFLNNYIFVVFVCMSHA